MTSRNLIAWFGGGVLVLGVVAVVVALTLSARRAERELAARAAQVRATEQERVELLRQRADAGAESGSGSGFDPHDLARIVEYPASATPTETRSEGELEESVYAIRGFEHAELHRVKGHPEAWSWLLLGTQGVEANDFGPSGSVHDLMAQSPASIGGFPIHGLFFRIDAGPLKDSVLVFSPASPFTPKPSFQVATVAFHQQTNSMILGSLCDFGLVPGVSAHAAEKFKDECFARVAKSLHKPEKTLFPSPWMLHDHAEGGCDRAISGVLENAPGWEYDCHFSAKTGKTTAKVRRKK